MKRYGFIYDKIADMDNLKAANARKDKKFYKDVVMVDSDPDFYLGQIREMLLTETYHVSAEDYTISTICDKGKDRELWKLPYFPHRIIQWAIMLQLEKVFHHSKEVLHWIRLKIEEFLSKLKLSLKSNWQVFPMAIRGVDFVGYRFFYGYTLLRKKTCQRFKRVCLKVRAVWEAGQQISYWLWCAVNSYKGWLKWCDGFRLIQKYIVPIQAALDDYYDNVILENSKKRKAAIA